MPETERRITRRGFLKKAALGALKTGALGVLGTAGIAITIEGAKEIDQSLAEETHALSDLSMDPETARRQWEDLRVRGVFIGATGVVVVVYVASQVTRAINDFFQNRY